MTTTPLQQSIGEAVRDGIARGVAVIGLAGVALIHVLDLPGTMSATPYIGWMYVGAIVTSLFLAGALIHGSHRLAWAGAAGLATSVMIGYSLSRTTGLPQSSADIGNWAQPLGMASLFVEGSVLALAGSMLFSRRTAPQPRFVARRTPVIYDGRLDAAV